MLSAASGCSETLPPTPDLCAIPNLGIIHLTRGTILALTPAEAAQVDDHNCTWKKLCLPQMFKTDCTNGN